MAERRALPNLGVHESKETASSRQGKARASFARALHSVSAGVQRLGQSCLDLVGTHAQRLVQLTATLALAVIGQTGTGRDQTTHNDVFLQAARSEERRVGKE